MPYSIDNPPDRISGLPKHAKEIWIAAFNSALKQYKDEGKANATAWSAVEKAGYSKDEKGEWHKTGGRSMTIQELWDKVRAIFEPELQERIKDVSSWSGAASNYSDTEAYCKACLINENTGSAADWVQAKCKLPVKDPGGTPVRQAIHAAAAALSGARGGVDASPEDKKKAANQIITYYNQMDEQAPDGVYKAAGKSPPARMIEYLPTQTRMLTVTRQADGKPRWMMIAASAVVNKVNAIDSTTLFDNFIRHAQETQEYPVLDFLHEEDRIRFGMADWLVRDGALYVASGSFDDTELARAAVAGLEKDPTYWGASISYRITEPPMILQAEGSIPVYTDGVNNFISIVPRRMAANLFTAASISKEVSRMNKAAFDELVKLVGEAAAQQFANQVDDANRVIAETGMVVRADTTTTPPEATEVATTTATDPPTGWNVINFKEQRDVVVQAATPPAEAAPAITLEALAAMVKELAAQVESLKAGYGMMQEESVRSAEEQKRVIPALDDITSRLAVVESLKDRWQQWLDDAPEHVKVQAEGIVRARNQPPAPMTMAQIAEQNLSKMNRGPHQRRGGA